MKANLDWGTNFSPLEDSYKNNFIRSLLLNFLKFNKEWGDLFFRAMKVTFPEHDVELNNI